MTPTNEQIIAEAIRRRKERGVEGIVLADFIIEVTRENWTPPEPEPVDPDVLAFREWLASDHEADGWTGGATLCRLGRHDGSEEARAYLAGARMAREQERERAKVLEEFAEDIAKFSLNYGVRANRALAKYRGEA